MLVSKSSLSRSVKNELLAVILRLLTESGDGILTCIYLYVSLFKTTLDVFGYPRNTFRSYIRS